MLLKVKKAELKKRCKEVIQNIDQHNSMVILSLMKDELKKKHTVKGIKAVFIKREDRAPSDEKLAELTKEYVKNSKTVSDLRALYSDLTGRGVSPLIKIGRGWRDLAEDLLKAIEHEPSDEVTLNTTDEISILSVWKNNGNQET